MSRPTILTEELTDSLCLLLRHGHYIDTACALAGVHKQRVYEWLAKADEPEAKEAYIVFADSIKKARAEAEHVSLGVIRDAGEKSWQAAAWYLERTQPDKYGQKTRTDVTVREPIEVEFKIIDSKT